MGPANTNLLVYNGKLLATYETDKPYQLEVSFDGQKNLKTIGKETFGGQLNHPVAAHPKVDPVTGEMMVPFPSLPSASISLRMLTCGTPKKLNYESNGKF
jgi:carotenoid cleavage dioxygenase-like enzyme